jgi:glycosyltransferase involved in cell wall biosynthesis
MIETRQTLATAIARVCVAIPTFRRPESLATLLDAVAAQEDLPDISLHVLVIDNDHLPSSRAVVETRRAGFPFELTYEHASEPGLSSVRNFALSRARAGFDALVMIDDDERPEPLWLRELLRVQGETEADVVIGPVIHVIPEDAPRWLHRTKLYRLPAVADGQAIEFGYSGNCLLMVQSLERFDVTFDKDLNFAGGEDMLFFRQLVARGAKMRFAARALAFEPVERDRLTVAYLLRLHFRRGNTLSLCDRRLNGSARSRIIRAVKGTARVLLGALCLLPLSVLRGREGAIEALSSVAHGFGSLVGLGGHVYQAYKRVD